MSTLPRVSGRECVRALQKVGFILMRQKGSHIISAAKNPSPNSLCPTMGSLTAEQFVPLSGSPA